MNGCLSTSIQLLQKNVDVSHVCAMCGNLGTISHFLLSCALGNSCWFSGGLSTLVNIPDSFGTWLASFFENNDDDRLAKLKLSLLGHLESWKRAYLE